MSPKLPRITSQELLRALKRTGWEPIRQTGSHLHLAHPARPGHIITVAVHPGKLVPLGTLKAILDRAGLTGDDLRRLL